MSSLFIFFLWQVETCPSRKGFWKKANTNDSRKVRRSLISHNCWNEGERTCLYVQSYRVPEAKFLDVIGTYVLREFSSLLFTVTSTNILRLVCNVNIVNGSDRKSYNFFSLIRSNEVSKNPSFLYWFQKCTFDLRKKVHPKKPKKPFLWDRFSLNFFCVHFYYYYFYYYIFTFTIKFAFLKPVWNKLVFWYPVRFIWWGNKSFLRFYLKNARNRSIFPQKGFL